MGPCGEEAARCARDTVCPVPSPTRCLHVGAQGLGSRALLSEGDLQSCPRLWKGSGAPAGGQEAAGLGLLPSFPQSSGKEVSRRSGRRGGG